MQNPPSIKNNPNVLPMPAELFHPMEDKENAESLPFYNTSLNLVVECPN